MKIIILLISVFSYSLNAAPLHLGDEEEALRERVVDLESKAGFRALPSGHRKSGLWKIVNGKVGGKQAYHVVVPAEVSKSNPLYNIKEVEKVIVPTGKAKTYAEAKKRCAALAPLGVWTLPSELDQLHIILIELSEKLVLPVPVDRGVPKAAMYPMWVQGKDSEKANTGAPGDYFGYSQDGKGVGLFFDSYGSVVARALQLKAAEEAKSFFKRDRDVMKNAEAVQQFFGAGVPVFCVAK